MNRALKAGKGARLDAVDGIQMRCAAGISSAFLIGVIMNLAIEPHLPLGTPNAGPSPAPMRLNFAKARTTGFTIVQTVIAMGVIAISGAAGMMALVQLNNKAAAMRTLNNARSVVQRNIDTALAVSFSGSQQPAILAVTSVAGAIHDDDGGGDNLVTLFTPKTGAAGTLKGTLRRIVTAQANSDSADIRRITFRLDYTVRGRPYSYAMTTLRGSD